MCGISAVFKYDGVTPHDKSCLKSMNDEMSYRGPNENGVWNDNRCGLAHTRLSIIGLENGHQPIYNEDKSLVLVCNGEIYNYKNLIQKLESLGHSFSTQSDSEVIIHLYEEYGFDCLKHLRGMFAFCLYDKSNESLFCARDRIGEKTLYYTHIQCGIVVSTELKAILKYYIDKPQINTRNLFETIRFGFPIECKHTYIEQISRLLPGEYAVIDERGLETHLYWNKHSIDKFEGTKQEAQKETLRLMKESVSNCLQSDVPVAVLLSGGIDSSAIAAFAKETGKEIHCISAGYKGNYSCDERSVAKKFAYEKGLIYHEIELDVNDYKDIFEEYISYYDEPVADIASIAQWAIYKKAKQLGFTVLLGGLGGDELFYGYPVHNRCAEALKIRNEIVSTKSRYHWLKTIIQNIRFFDPHRRMRIDDRWPVDWVVEDYEKFSNNAVFCYDGVEYNVNRTHVNYNYPYNSDIDTVYDMLFTNFMTNQCLYLADRLSMGNSIELRSPLVDYKLVEFVTSLPLDIKYTKGKPKQFLKEILKGIVPDEILYGTKKGFTPPGNFIQEICAEYKYNYFNSKHVYFNSMLADNLLSELYRYKTNTITKSCNRISIV